MKEEKNVNETSQIRPANTAEGCPLVVPKPLIIPESIFKPWRKAVKKARTRRWHVMRCSYNRELQVLEYLKSHGHECYVPTVSEANCYDKSGQRITEPKSMLPNMLFFRGTTDEIYQVKQQLPHDFPLHFYLDHTAEPPIPMTIPDKMMQDFIEEVTRRQNELLWLDHPADVFTKGRKVRVTYGPLRGREGFVLRIKRDRRFVLTLNGFCSAAIMNVADFHYDWVEPME